MIREYFRHLILDKRGEVNMIAIVLIIIVVIILGAIFKTSLEKILGDIFKRIENDILNF